MKRTSMSPFWRLAVTGKTLGAAVVATVLALGSSDGWAQFPTSFDLSSLDGTNGFVISGIDRSDNSGVSVSSGGDVNGDGIDDVIISAERGDPNENVNAGESYVVFGRRGDFFPALDLSTLDGANGFVINGVDAGDSFDDSPIEFTATAAAAGDINGDGIDDLVIGADRADPNGNSSAGESYVVFGRLGGYSGSLDLSSLDGTNGFVLNGVDADDFSGRSVSSAGDVNGDGNDDLFIGAPYASPNGNVLAGESYVVFGSNGGFPSSLDLSTLDGTNGFVINGIDVRDVSGSSVSGVGDFNNDGIDDLLIGAPGADPNGNGSAGESYVVYGKVNGFSESIDLSTLDGTDGFEIRGIHVGDASGRSVSGLGDFNDDGISDLIIGATGGRLNGNTLAGESYVVFGQDGGFLRIDLVALNGASGFAIRGIDVDDESGRSVSGAGDVNGDGINDLIIGAPFADPNEKLSAGESYVVFGSNDEFSSPFELSSLDGTNGFVINGVDARDQSGFSVSGAGDFNGDGIDDLIIGAITAGTPGREAAGASYVVFGRRLGDFDRDGDVDADDVDFYNGNLGQPASFNPELDLNNDGMITLADHDQHVTTLVETSNGEVGALLGDINLDGDVDVLGDAFILVANLGSSNSVGYADGDLNANGAVDVVDDVFRLIANLGQSNE